jgi:hypothetical protein
MNYEQDIRIDDSALDIEWCEQPALFWKYAKYAAQCRKDVDFAKQKLDVTKAELDNDIRENPAKYGLEKVTDKAIEAVIVTCEDYKVAYKAFLDAKFESDMSSSAVSAMNQKKEALENLVRLHGQSYFAGPKIPRDLRKERTEFTKTSSNEHISIKSIPIPTITRTK